jgi:hypothetical protein
MEKILRPESLSYKLVRYCSCSSTGITHELVCLLHVGTLETSNDGCLQVHALNNGDQTLGDGVTADDTTEDVDEDGSDLGVAGDEVERLPDGLGGGTATDVQEVGGRTAVQLDDVHGGHGKTGTVDEAANVTVKLDEVEANLGGLDLVSVLLGDVPPFEDLLLAEIGVVVEPELGVHGKDLVVGGLGQGVDLDLGGIALGEDLVELLDGVLGVLDALLREANLGSNVASNLVGNTGVDVDGGGDDGLGVLLCDRLNVHATLRRGDDDGALRGAVHEDGEVELAARKLAVDNVDGVAETTCGSGLLGDELVADHLVGEDGGLARRVDDPDTALEAVVEGTLSSSTSKDLGLDDGVLSTCARISLGPQPAFWCERIPMSLAICSASAAVVATPPLGTPMPY